MIGLKSYKFTLTNGDTFTLTTDEDVFDSVGATLRTRVAYVVNNTDGTRNLINPAHIIRIDQTDSKESN